MATLLELYNVYTGVNEELIHRFYMALVKEANYDIQNPGTHSSTRLATCESVLTDDSYANRLASRFIKRAVLENTALQTSGTLADSDISWLVANFLGE